MGEQNYLELKHSRSVNNSDLGRKTPRSFNSSCEGFGFVSKPNYVFVTEWGCSVWGGNCKFCGIGSIDQKKMLSADQPVAFLPCPPIDFPHRLNFLICALFTLWDHREFWGEVTMSETGLLWSHNWGTAPTHALWDAEVIENRTGRVHPIAGSIPQIFDYSVIEMLQW